MVLGTLTQEERAMLEEVVASRRPDLKGLLLRLGSVPLSREEREELRGALADEFVETGLEADSEPNGRGLLLDDLIDRLGHL